MMHRLTCEPILNSVARAGTIMLVCVASLATSGVAMAQAVAPAEPPVSAAAPAGPGEGTPSELDIFQLDDALSKVVSVTKSEQTVEEVAAIVETFSREEIFQMGFQSVADLLRYVVGFYVEDDHIIPNVAVRGFSAGLFGESRILKLLIDGQSLAYRSTGGAWLGPELIPLTAVERVEILRGPASALYGADAFLGVVNIVTRSAEKLSGAQVRSQLGFNSVQPGNVAWDIDAAQGFKKGAFSLLLALRLNDENRSGMTLPSSSPSPAIPDYNSGKTVANGLTMASRVGYGRASFQINEDTMLNVYGYLSGIDRGAEFASWSQLTHGLTPTGVSNGTDISLYQGTVGANAQTKPTKDITLTFNAEWFTGGPRAEDRIEVSSDLFWVKRHYGYSGADLNAEIMAKLPANVQLFGGVSFYYDHEQLPEIVRVLKLDIGSQRLGDSLTLAPNPDGRTKDLFNIGAYTQLTWAPLDQLSLTGGLRYDYHRIYGNQVSGRFAVVSKLADHFYLKGLYGGAFSAPPPLLLYGVPLQVGDVIGNPSLKSQYVHTFEAQASYEPSPVWHGQLGVTYNLLRGAAQFVPQGANQGAINVGTIDTLSVEAQVEAHYEDWIKVALKGEYNYTVDDAGYVGYRAQLMGTNNVVYPNFLVRLTALGRIPGVPLRVGLSAVEVGARRSTEINSLENGGQYTLAPYTLLDASLSSVGVHLVGEHETVLMFSARNVLATTGPDPGFSGFDYPLWGPTFWLQARQEL